MPVMQTAGHLGLEGEFEGLLWRIRMAREEGWVLKEEILCYHLIISALF
jgi:hypothetical protein